MAVGVFERSELELVVDCGVDFLEVLHGIRLPRALRRHIMAKVTAEFAGKRRSEAAKVRITNEVEEMCAPHLPPATVGATNLPRVFFDGTVIVPRGRAWPVREGDWVF